MSVLFGLVVDPLMFTVGIMYLVGYEVIYTDPKYLILLEGTMISISGARTGTTRLSFNQIALSAAGSGWTSSATVPPRKDIRMPLSINRTRIDSSLLFSTGFLALV